MTAAPSAIPHQDQATSQNRSSSASSPLAALISLESQLRRVATLDALRILVSNESRRTINYRQAFVLECIAGRWFVSAVSSVSRVDRNAPLLLSISKGVAECDFSNGHAAIDMAKAGLDFGEATYPFSKGFAVPLRDRGGKIFAALVFARETAWTEMEIALGGAIADATAHAWLALKPRRSLFAVLPRKRILAASALAFFLISFIPVPLTALAPAEVVGRKPVVVSAPLDGVVANLPKLPNETVAEGDVILTFVDTKLRNDAEIAEQNRSIAVARLHRLVQSAFGVPKDAHDIAIARAELALAEAEHQRAKELLERAVVRAPRSGLLVYSAPEDWLGKPLATGERVMEIVDPKSVEIRIDLALADVIALRSGAKATFFPDGDPLDKHELVVERVGYRAMPMPDGQLAYRNFARLESMQQAPLRVGLRGTAKIYGEDVPLLLYLTRRPLAIIRQQVGL